MRFSDPFGGDRLAIERNRGPQPVPAMRSGQRYCETCQQLKPRGKRQARKGWKCDDCFYRRTPR